MRAPRRLGFLLGPSFAGQSLYIYIYIYLYELDTKQSTCLRYFERRTPKIAFSRSAGDARFFVRKPCLLGYDHADHHAPTAQRS